MTAPQAPPRKRTARTDKPEQVAELSRELILDAGDPTFREVRIFQSVSNPEPPPGAQPVRTSRALRVHSFTPSMRRKNKIDHLTGTAYLRDEPDLHQLARAIVLMADRIQAEKRQQQTDKDPPAIAA